MSFPSKNMKNIRVRPYQNSPIKTVVRIPDVPANEVLPATLENTLVYVSHVIGYNNAGNTWGAASWRPDSPFVPDVSGTDTSSARGAFVCQSVYDKYLVLSADINISVVNEEDFDLVFVMAVANTDYDTIINSATDVTQMAESEFVRKKVLSRNSGQNRSVFNMRVDMAKLVGSKRNYYSDLSFCGSGSSYPGLAKYLILAIASLSNNFVDGITFLLTIKYRIRWFQKKLTDITPDAYLLLPRSKSFGSLRLIPDSSGPLLDKQPGDETSSSSSGGPSPDKQSVDDMVSLIKTLIADLSVATRDGAVRSNPNSA